MAVVLVRQKEGAEAGRAMKCTVHAMKCTVHKEACNFPPFPFLLFLSSLCRKLGEGC